MTDERIVEYMSTLANETKELRDVRNEFGPIYEYYFPKTWGGVLMRTIGVKPQPDFGKHDEELGRIKDSAWKIVERAKAAYQSIQSESQDKDIKEWAELGFPPA